MYFIGLSSESSYDKYMRLIEINEGLHLSKGESSFMFHRDMKVVEMVSLYCVTVVPLEPIQYLCNIFLYAQQTYFTVVLTYDCLTFSSFSVIFKGRRFVFYYYTEIPCL